MIEHLHLAHITTDELQSVLAASAPAVALITVGSVEPHGPHLPLGTDTVISEAAALRAAPILRARAIAAFCAPPIPYGVTDYASGFAGAVSVEAPVLTPFIAAVVGGYLRGGFAHVCLVNNHLEPEHDAAVRAVLSAFEDGQVSLACPLTRRWGRTLTAEFKSGACHAGQYETSIVLASAPETVRTNVMCQLEDVPVSLSESIKSGLNRFNAMGMDRAYAGSPAQATAEEGQATLDRLAEMIVTEVCEGLAKR